MDSKCVKVDGMPFENWVTEFLDDTSKYPVSFKDLTSYLRISKEVVGAEGVVVLIWKYKDPYGWASFAEYPQMSSTVARVEACKRSILSYKCVIERCKEDLAVIENEMIDGLNAYVALRGKEDEETD